MLDPASNVLTVNIILLSFLPQDRPLVSIRLNSLLLVQGNDVAEGSDVRIADQREGTLQNMGIINTVLS